MPDVSRELRAAVHRLYKVFASQPRRAKIEFCDHCVSPQEAEALVTTPLQEVGADLLRVFVLNAMSETWGDWEDLRFYLPRVLELVAMGKLDRYDIMGLFSGMGLRWHDWPQDQHDALASYLAALWRATLTGYWLPSNLDVLDVLEAAGDLGVPIDSFLGEWETGSSEPSVLHLTWLIRHGPSRWESKPTAGWSQTIDQWVMGPAPKRVLTSALTTASTPEIAANLSGALRILDSWASSGA